MEKKQIHLDKIADGIFIKIGTTEESWKECIRSIGRMSLIEHPSTAFNAMKLSKQIREECVWHLALNLNGSGMRINKALAIVFH